MSPSDSWFSINICDLFCLLPANISEGRWISPRLLLPPSPTSLGPQRFLSYFLLDCHPPTPPQLPCVVRYLCAIFMEGGGAHFRGTVHQPCPNPNLSRPLGLPEHRGLGLPQGQKEGWDRSRNHQRSPLFVPSSTLPSRLSRNSRFDWTNNSN